MEKEIGLVDFKKATGRQTVTYKESVDEALCFGWIDGITRGIGEESYVSRFTPRKPKSIWSLVNKNACERLVTEGKMTEAGMRMIEIARQNGQWGAAYSMKDEQEIPTDFKSALLKTKRRGRIFRNSAIQINSLISGRLT